jgi:hypothetical protein
MPHLFVAPITMTRDSLLLPTPSNCTRNSVLSRLDASCSFALRVDSSASISSMKMIEGWRSIAMSNMARTCDTAGTGAQQGLCVSTPRHAWH